MPRFVRLALSGLAVVFAPSSASASNPPPRAAELHYVRDAAAQACAEPEELESKVSARLGYVPFRDHAPLVVSVRISRSDKGFKAALKSEDIASHTSGAREISSGSRDCGELLESVALAISVVIDPLTLSRPEPPANPHVIVLTPPAVEPSPPALAPPPAVAPPVKPSLDERPSPAPPAPVEHVPVTVETSLAVVASAGVEPSPALGYALAVGLRRRSLSLAVEGRADMPAGTDTVDGRSVRSNVMVGSLVPCVRPGPLLACAVLSAGALNGTGEGVALSSPRTTFYSAAGARGGAQWAPLDSLAFGGYVEVLATLTRTDLRLNGATVWTTPPFSGGLGLQAIGRF